MSRARPLSRRTDSLVAVLVIALSAVRLDAASLFDPALRFRTLTTEHFSIHFHQGEEALAARLARIAESVWIDVGRALQVAAPRKTHVVLADQSELANGWATPLPYNTIFITAASPPASEYIGRTDDWLRLVFTHEFTHIVHLDRSEGWARVFRGIFGRTAVAFPNLWLPTWQIEGLATWQESAQSAGGRRHAGDFRAIERQAAREQRVPPLDRINGGLTDWPNGLAPYAYGLGFYEYLATRFGDARFGELASATARRLPFLGSTAFARIYGASLGTLWNDYTKTLVDGVSKEPAAIGAAKRLSRHGHVVLGPRFLPPACETCAAEIAYSARNPHGFPALRAVALNGSTSRQLATRYLGSTMGVSRDIVVFDQQELRRNVAVYSDLHVLDRRTGSTRALTREERLQDPDLSPDGTAIACVRENRGRRDLVLVRLVPADSPRPSAVDRIAVAEIVTLISEADTRFNTPRWSPDGTALAVERQRLYGNAEIVLVNVDTRANRVLATNPNARIVTPAWRPDGKAIVAAAAFEDGTFNLHEFIVGDQPLVSGRRLTDMPGGALWPDVSADGKTLTFAGYTADGFDVFLMPYPTTSAIEETVTIPGGHRGPPEDVRTPVEPPVESYSPWPTLLPTSWIPILETNTDQTRVGLALTGYDVLARHAYAASATWLVSGPHNLEHPRATPDWSLAYAYDRWQPTLFLSASRTTFFSAGQPDLRGRPMEGTLRESDVEAGIVLPFRRVRHSERVVASLVRTEGRFTSATETRQRTRTAIRFGAAVNSTHTYGYSISPEHGITAGGTTEIIPTTADSGEATVVTGDIRAFLPGARAHHVVAIRAAGGVASGEAQLGRTFLLGGAGPNASVLNFGRGALGLLRAFPSQAFAGARGTLMNLDYRWPIARPQRGTGTWPFFLHTIHAAVFVDAGHVWTDRFRIADMKTSVGAELAMNVLAGYSFAFTLTGGAAWGHDGAERRDTRAAYVRIGRAF